MIGYLDSSVLLRWLLGEPDQIKDLKKIDKFYSSVLLRIESKRVLHRLLKISDITESEFEKLSRDLRDLLKRVNLIEFGRSIQRRSEESFTFNIGTLEAIHLASALAIRGLDGVIFLTHDRDLARNARALEFELLGI